MLTVIKPGAILLTPLDEIMQMPKRLEEAGRTCYKSEHAITDDSAGKFVRMICRNHHESVLEHCSISARIICSRACSHQIVRHRLAAYSQESQRYINYGRCAGLKVVAPPSLEFPAGNYYDSGLGNPSAWYRSAGPTDNTLIPELRKANWLRAVEASYLAYIAELNVGRPEDARYLLPNATKTELVMTMNLRMWRHVLRERAQNPKAQWEIRGIFSGLYTKLVTKLPCVFGDLR
jgi:thymidylate synthase (FAD)